MLSEQVESCLLKHRGSENAIAGAYRLDVLQMRKIAG